MHSDGEDTWPTDCSPSVLEFDSIQPQPLQRARTSGSTQSWPLSPHVVVAVEPQVDAQQSPLSYLHLCGNQNFTARSC